MSRRIAALTMLFFTATACTSAQRETAAWVVLTPVAVVVGPIVVASQQMSRGRSRDQRAEEWRAVSEPVYLERIERIEGWSPVEDANRYWRQGDVVYWRANGSKMRFTGLNPPAAATLAAIDSETIFANYQVYADDPELRKRAEALSVDLTGVHHPLDHSELNGVVFACFEETAAEYRYRFNVRMASLTGEYEALPDYSEEITMDVDDPCSRVTGATEQVGAS